MKFFISYAGTCLKIWTSFDERVIRMWSPLMKGKPAFLRIILAFFVIRGYWIEWLIASMVLLCSLPVVTFSYTYWCILKIYLNIEEIPGLGRKVVSKVVPKSGTKKEIRRLCSIHRDEKWWQKWWFRTFFFIWWTRSVGWIHGLFVCRVLYAGNVDTALTGPSG